MSAFPRVSSRFVSHCAPYRFPWMVCPPSRGSCLNLSPFLFPFVGWCVRLPEGCTPSRFPLLDGVSAFPRVSSRFVSHCAPYRFLWMVCPPSRGSCLNLSPFLFPFVGWCVRLSEGLDSPCLPFYTFLYRCVGWCVRLPKGRVPLVAHCLPFCFPLLDGVFAFARVLPPLSLPLYPFLFPLDGVSAFPRVLSPLVSLCWMVRPPSRGLVPLSSMVSLLVSFCWIVFPPSELIPSLSPSLFPLVGWCVRLPKALFLLACLPLSPIVPFLFPFVGWCVPRSCLPLSPFLFPFVG